MPESVEELSAFNEKIGQVICNPLFKPQLCPFSVWTRAKSNLITGSEW